MKTGLVLEGGALRGVFTCGILDCFQENGINFPYVIGVSAGGGNALNFVSRQKHRTFDVAVPHKEHPYFGMRRFFQCGKILDLDRMFYEYPFDQYPLDFDTYFASSVETEFVAVNCDSGCAEYLSERSDKHRLLTIGKASCSVPIMCKPVELDGAYYLDGSVANAVPFNRAFERGCNRAVVIMTKKGNESATDYKKYSLLLSLLYKKKYPKLYDLLMHRKESYDKEIESLNKNVQEGRILLIRPETESVKKFDKDMEKLENFYSHGYEFAQKHLDDIRNFVDGKQVHFIGQ